MAADGMGDWEVDINQLDIESKIAQGSFGTLYKGYYCSQEVAVKILRDVQEDPQQYQEFLQVRSLPLSRSRFVGNGVILSQRLLLH